MGSPRCLRCGMGKPDGAGDLHDTEAECRNALGSALTRALGHIKDLEEECNGLREENVNIIDCSKGTVENLDGNPVTCKNLKSTVDPKGCLTHLNEKVEHLETTKNILDLWEKYDGETDLAKKAKLYTELLEARLLFAKKVKK